MRTDGVKKNVVYNFFYHLLILLVPLVTTPYVSRVLGADKIGNFTYNYSIAAYFVLFIMLGLNNYGNRTIAAVRDDDAKLSKTFTSIYCMQLSIGSIVCLIYAVYILLFSRTIMAVIMLLYVVSAVIDINWFFFGIEQFKLTIIRNTAIKILSVACIFTFVNDRNDIYIYAIVMVGSSLVSQLAMWPFLHRFIRFEKPSKHDVITHVKPNLILFIPIIAISLYKLMDKIMIGALSTDSDVGYYENVEKIINVPVSLVQALGTVMLPRMSNLVAHNQVEKGRRYLYLSILFSVLLSSSISFGIMGVCKEFVPVYYGNGFEPCIQIFLILAPSTIFMALANVIRTQYLIPKHKDKIYITSVFLGAIVNVIVNAALIPSLRGAGAAIGTLIAEATVCIYQLIMVKNELPLSKPLLRSSPMIASGIVMYILLYYIKFDSYTNAEVLIWKILSGCFLYILLIFVIYGTRRYVFKKPSLFKD